MNYKEFSVFQRESLHNLLIVKKELKEPLPILELLISQQMTKMDEKNIERVKRELGM